MPSKLLPESVVALTRRTAFWETRVSVPYIHLHQPHMALVASPDHSLQAQRTDRLIYNLIPASGKLLVSDQGFWPSAGGCGL